MDDATSGPCDSVSTATVTTTERPFTNKPRRLARGLNELFARQSASHRAATGAPAMAPPADEPVAREAAEPQGPAAPIPVSATLAIKPSDDSSPTATGFEYRFAQLISRLDATCGLLADARQTQQAAVQRSSRVTLCAAAVLAIIAGGLLWWAGSIAAWNRGQLEYEQARAAIVEKSLNALTAQNTVITAGSQSLDDQHRALKQQSDTIKLELETIRTSLSKANAVIDELMSRPVEVGK